MLGPRFTTALVLVCSCSPPALGQEIGLLVPEIVPARSVESALVAASPYPTSGTPNLASPLATSWTPPADLVSPPLPRSSSLGPIASADFERLVNPLGSMAPLQTASRDLVQPPASPASFRAIPNLPELRARPVLHAPGGARIPLSPW